MNQSSTSSSKTHKQKKCCEALMPPEITKVENRVKKKKQQQQNLRDPFQDISNNLSIGGVDHGTPSNISSMSSIEAPKGCLRFFLPHSSSSSAVKTPRTNRTYLGLIKARSFTSRTPKSAPNVRPTRENSSKRTVFRKPISQKLEKSKGNTSPCMYQRHSGKKFTSGNAAKSKISSVLGSGSSHGIKLKPGIGESKQVVVNGVSDYDRTNLTPLSKVASRSAVNLAIDGGALAQHGDGISNADMNTGAAGSNTKTPPVQASVSPEIQCGSTLVSTTTEKSMPACYAAGHVLSGIIDKRKCRPRGLLTVGEAKALCNFDSDEDTDQDNAFGLANNCGISMLPLPTEASMRWLLSSCNEGDGDQKEKSEESYCPQRLEESNAPNCSSPPCSSGLSLYLCNFTKEEDRKNHYDLDGKDSPFSISSADDENVVQTPKSNSSSERRVAMLLLGENKQNFGCELDSVAEHLRMASLSPRSYESIWDPRSSIFQFECLNAPSDSVDLSQFQKVLDDRASWLSNSTLADVSQSQMRISWREGLVSRIFELDEIDCCRCLSDEEDDATCYRNNPLKPVQSPEFNVGVKHDQIPSNAFGSTEFLIDRNAKEEILSQEPCSCAESISTDGGDLVRSDDSDWALCYKNQLFKV